MRRNVAHTVTFATLLALSVILLGSAAHASLQARIMRIDPRAGLKEGKPSLTMVLDLVNTERMGTALQPCANITNTSAMYTCWSENLETKPLWKGVDFHESNAKFLVRVGSEDFPATFESKIRWGDASKQNQAGVGTAWVIALDASNGMGARYQDAKQVAWAFADQMRPNDLMDILIFDDRQVILESKWLTYAERGKLVETLKQQAHVAPARGSGRPLFDIIKGITKDAFGSLGGFGSPDKVPMHQAMVVLSNGAGRNDASTTGAGADMFTKYLNNGRFPEENKSLPKTPLPVISIFFPNPGTDIKTDLYKNNDSQFMQNLANPEIGGFFDVIQAGQAVLKAPVINRLVRARFDAMWIVRYRVSCLNPTALQSFNLMFEKTTPQIMPDGSFQEVPIGVDPTEWPLSLDIDKTMKDAQSNPVTPGKTFKVYGDFCWGGNKDSAEVYFIPPGMQRPPQQSSRDPDYIKKQVQALVAEGLNGPATDANAVFASFKAPDVEKILHGEGENATVRVVVYDKVSKRVSALDDKTVLQLKAQKKPLNVWLIGGAATVGLIVLLLIIVVFRSGGGKKKGGNTPPPPPPAPYGAPPFGGGPGYPGGGPGGYGGPSHFAAGGGSVAMAEPAPIAVRIGQSGDVAMPQGQSVPMSPRGQDGPAVVGHAPVPEPASMGPPQHLPGPPSAAAGSNVAPFVQVNCPQCKKQTTVTLGQLSVCFQCGAPIPSELALSEGSFPLTSAIASDHLVPPPNPYGTDAQHGIVEGPPGRFVVRAGLEVLVGRDPAKCGVLLAEPRVSGIHATLKFEAGKLWVRDEGSNNGTSIDGQRINPRTFCPVPPRAVLKFGPIEFKAALSS